MNKKIFYSLALSAAALVPSGLMADNPTPDAAASQMQTHLRLDIKDDTKEVHFINTNNDPSVFTKIYVLKHADPYELRPYIRSAVNARRVDTSLTKVEAIKYNDGTNMLIVTAEDFRFGPQEGGGMGIDQIIEMLDQPKVSSSSGHKFLLYFPKYWDATSLQTVLVNVGVNVANDASELDGGKDRVRVDNNLNALFFYAPQYSFKHITKMLELYDTPTSEAKIKYTIYELDYENDGKLGVDFQAWKNGPGSDLFAVSSRYTNGWDITNMNVSTRPWINNSHTRYFSFNPKWNTRFLDFLTARSKAKVITSGTMSIMNNQEGHIENTTRIPYIQDGAAIAANVTINDYIRLTDVTWEAAAPAANVYRINGAVDKHGEPISLLREDGATNVGAANVDFVITRSTVQNETYYYMKADTGANAWFFNSAGKNLGKTVRAYDVVLEQRNALNTAWVAQTNWQTDRNMTIEKDVQRDSAIQGYGFNLTITPVVCEKATTLQVNMTNTNLIGFTDAGAPRTSRSEVNTEVMIGNGGQKFVIGGLEKKAIVKSVSKVPWLGSIPGLGWVFSSESEVVKKTQIVAVIECVPVQADEKLPAEVVNAIKEVDEGVKKNDSEGRTIQINNFGFDQFLLDSDKKSLDPLP